MAEIHLRDPRITGLSLNIDDDPFDEDVVHALVDLNQTTPTYSVTPGGVPSVQASSCVGVYSPNTSAPNPNQWVQPNTFAPLTGVWDGATFDLQLPDPCEGGHVADPKFTEIADDGEVLAKYIVTQCIGCGEKIIVERVPGGIPALQLKLFVGSVMGLDLDIEDEDFNVSEMLGALKTLKEAIEREDDSLKRAKSLVALGEKILRKKIDERSV